MTLDESRIQVLCGDVCAPRLGVTEAEWNACCCEVDQIAKSIIFRGEGTGHVVLFLTAGGNRVDPA